MKTIIVEGVTKYRTTCRECAAVFTYELVDVHHNYVRGGDYVSCPGCGSACRHLGAVGLGLGRRDRTRGRRSTHWLDGCEPFGSLPRSSCFR